jgi:hypothetical protein
MRFSDARVRQEALAFGVICRGATEVSEMGSS